MKHFLIKILLFLLTFAALEMSVSYIIYYKNVSNFAYKRFTVPKQRSLIIGTSRAAQAINPDILSVRLGCPPSYNYCFTIADSPSGEVYFNAITKMVDTSYNNGFFLIAVDPWFISSSFHDGEETIYETDRVLGKMKTYHMNPNVEFILRYFSFTDFSWFGIGSKLLDNGQLYVPVDYSVEEKSRVLASRIEEYKSNNREFSSYRLMWLEKTIIYLLDYGDVVLCRLPVAEEMLELENARFPSFNTTIKDLAVKYSLNYYDLTDRYNDYPTNDGNHINYKYVDQLTNEICDSIILNNKVY